jgi:hypothetical protein
MNSTLLILLIPLARFLININYWNFMRRVINHHNDWLAGFDEAVDTLAGEKAQRSSHWLQTNTLEITRIYLRTGREKPTETFMEPVGYGHVQQRNLNVLDNLMYPNQRILNRARDCLFLAKGHFLTQAKQSLNPIYWLEIVFFLPSSLVSASGIETTGKVTEIGLKVAQIIYWLAIVAAFIFNPGVFEFLYTHAKVT